VVAPATIFVQLPERVKIPAACGVISRLGHVALGPVLDGVPDVVEGVGLRALRIKVMEEPMVQSSAEGGGGVGVCSGGTGECAGGKGQYVARTCKRPPGIVSMASSTTLTCEGSDL